MSTVNCPACEEPLELDDAYRDWTVRCPHCDREFVPSERGRPPRERDVEEDDDRDDYVYGYEQSDRREALELVGSPGLSLELCGWGGFVLTGIACLLLIAGVAGGRNNRNGDAEGLLLVGCCVGVFMLPYSLVIALGGRHMRNLSSRGWAMTAAIMGVAAIPLLGCLGVVHGALGVWALVTLEKPVVRRAFGVPDRNRRRWE